MAFDMRQNSSPWGPPVTRAVIQDISTADFVDNNGFFAIARGDGTLTVRLANATDDDLDLDIAVTNGEFVKLGGREIPLRKVAMNATVGSIYVGYPR